MESKEVKIIGININSQLGILQSCKVQFNEENRLVAIKGEVGAGKSTLQKGMQLGTQGSDVLEDKLLYGKVDIETQLLDGDTSVFVGCKSDKHGKLTYVLYTKDDNGKVVKNPIIDGVKATPASYLKEMQTKLTWDVDKITSENMTTQKNMLLSLYKKELAESGVVFDKDSSDYEGSILHKIDLAENERTIKDVARKQNGGFATHLKDDGYDVSAPDSLPTRIDTTEIQASINKLTYSGTKKYDEAVTEKENEKEKLINKANEIENRMKAINISRNKENNEIDKRLSDIQEINDDITKDVNDVCFKIDSFLDEVLSEKDKNEVKEFLDSKISLNPLPKEKKHNIIPFSEEGKCIAKEEYLSICNDEDKAIIGELNTVRADYMKVHKKVIDKDSLVEDNTAKLAELNTKLSSAEANNKVCDAIDSYFGWRDSDNEVKKLKDEYASLLASINTGVEGLDISVDKENDNLQIYLTYNGHYDPKYFNNPNKEQRKLSSYSGTQKPMVCLLLQNYLLSKKPKSMRYLWVDNVPIDSKTRALLEKMGKELDLTIIVNITGDFDKSTLLDGEILVEGGNVFFDKEG